MELSRTLNNCTISKHFFFNRLKNRGKIVKIWFPHKYYSRNRRIVMGEIICDIDAERKKNYTHKQILIKPLDLNERDEDYLYYNEMGENKLHGATCRYFSETDIIWD